MNSTAVEIHPVQQHSFVNPVDDASYYCNSCEQYSKAFYHSAIKTKYRRCVPCHRSTLRELNDQRDDVDRLVAKLKNNLIYHRRGDMARAVSRDHVIDIIKQEGLLYAIQLQLIKTISPNYDLIKQRWTFKVVFKTGSSPKAQNKHKVEQNY
jgi:hypothetical protein